MKWLWRLLGIESDEEYFARNPKEVRRVTLDGRTIVKDEHLFSLVRKLKAAMKDNT